MNLDRPLQQSTVETLSAALRRLSSIAENPNLPKEQLRELTYRDQLALSAITAPPHRGGLPQLDPKSPKYFEDILQRSVLSSSILALDSGMNPKYQFRAELATRTKELLSQWIRLHELPVDEKLLAPKTSAGSTPTTVRIDSSGTKVSVTPALKEFAESLSSALKGSAVLGVAESVRKDLVEKSLLAIRSLNNGNLPDRNPATFERVEAQRRIETALTWIRHSGPGLGVDTLQAVAREIQRGTGMDFEKSLLSGQLNTLLLPIKPK